MEEKKRRLKMPHAYVIIFLMTVITAVLANVVPAGVYDRVEDASGNVVVVADSFHEVEHIGCSVWDMFMAVEQGFSSSANIIFFIMFAYSFVYILIKNGTFDALVGFVLQTIGDRVEFIIPVCMLLFGILGSTMGMFEETYGLIPVFISIAALIGYDAMVGGSIIYIGVAVGFAAATINPFTVGIAQQVAGVQMFSGLGYRIFCFVIFMGIAIGYVWHYARAVKKDPKKSYLYGYEIEKMEVTVTREELMTMKMTATHKLSCLIFVATIAILLIGTLKYGWYIDEIATLFIVMMILAGLVSRFTASQICEYFIEASKEMMYGALLVGLSHSIPIIMENASIIDTVVHWLAMLLQNFSGLTSGIGMLFVQNIINFFIPSGGGQALVTIPILVPAGELVGISKQISVLAYQFGDGFSNIFWPTSVFMMCGIMRMPIDRWYRFVTPLFALLFVAQIVLLGGAFVIGY
ncbi:MAG: TIGR00366 family protein [Clostridiales bacterium]|nr:TIGR00366 family protein [Clostridiales bacterium]